MGWWGYEIMAGDEPCDIHYDIEELISASLIAAGPHNVQSLTDLFNERFGDGWNESIYWTVIGILVQDGDLHVNRQVMKHIVDVIDGMIDDVESEGWNDPVRRRNNLIDFKKELMVDL